MLERWSRGQSPLHRLDPRAKLGALLACLAALSTTPPSASVPAGALFLGAAIAGCLAARIPLWALLLRGAVVLPFSLTFAAIAILAGDTARVPALIVKTYISAVLVLLLMATTSLSKLLDALYRLKVPILLVEVVHLLWRYLFLISEQAQHMRLAAAARGGQPSFRRAAGAVAVLFGHSYERAENIQRAMAARGGDGRMPVLTTPVMGYSDFVFLLLTLLFAGAVRLGAL